MATKKRMVLSVTRERFCPRQCGTVVIGYTDSGSETIHRGTVLDFSGALLKIKKDEKETIVNTASVYFIKAGIEDNSFEGPVG